MGISNDQNRLKTILKHAGPYPFKARIVLITLFFSWVWYNDWHIDCQNYSDE